MAVSEAHKMASYKYNASRDSITIRPERSKGAAIRAAAAASTPARPTDNASRQPASTPPPAQRQRGQILHLTGYGFRLRA